MEWKRLPSLFLKTYTNHVNQESFDLVSVIWVWNYTSENYILSFIH